jgi:hypothetical protein
VKYPPRKQKKKKLTLKQKLEWIALGVAFLNEILELLNNLTGRR